MVLSRSQIAEFEDVLTQALKKESFIACITESITATIEARMEKIMNKYETLITRLTEEVTTLKSENQILKKECIDNVDKLEQYSRRNNLRFLGVAEEQNEDVENVIKDILNKKLHINTDKDVIERCHRVGPKLSNDGKPRPLIAKFISYKQKSMIYKLKSKLKGTKILIKEDLTHRRAMVVKELTTKYGRNGVWTSDGAIFYRDKSGIHKYKL